MTCSKNWGSAGAEFLHGSPAFTALGYAGINAGAGMAVNGWSTDHLKRDAIVGGVAGFFVVAPFSRWANVVVRGEKGMIHEPQGIPLAARITRNAAAGGTLGAYLASDNRWR